MRAGPRPDEGHGRSRGDEFAPLALSFIDALFGTALRLTRNRSAAEDLVQDTYVKAFRFADRFEPGTNLKAWLFTILYNTFRNDLRGARRSPVSVDSDALDEAAERPAPLSSPEERVLQSGRLREVQRALDTLPDAFRQAVWLRDVEEFTYAEIADMLDIPIGTVMSRISRGRNLLHRRLVGQTEPVAEG